MLEIITVVIIVATMTALAIPRYMMQAERVRIGEALQLLDALFNAQQSHFYENNVYATTLAELDIDISTPQSFNAPTVAVGPLIASITRTGGSYTLRVSNTRVISCVPTGGTCARLGY